MSEGGEIAGAKESEINRHFGLPDLAAFSENQDRPLLRSTGHSSVPLSGSEPLRAHPPPSVATTSSWQLLHK